ncbi:MAG: DUF1801 domain-containing protein [Rhodothermales bacterium]
MKSESLDAFLAQLDHPRKADILALRRLILDADASISDGVKWNSLSFRTTEWFATVHLRAKTGVQLILHLGARVREQPGITIADPAGLLTWLGKDRASVTFRDLADIQAREDAFSELIRAWIGFV